MGKIQFISREQKIVLDEVGKDNFLSSRFYFSGGTALSAFYLQHRYSQDLDFFSYDKFENQVIFGIVQKWSKKYNFTFEARFVEVVYNFNLLFEKGKIIKLDFAYYPYKQIEKPQIIKGVSVDSLFDIAANKLLIVSQRSDIKDFVDLYYLLPQFSIWDLREAVRAKFNVEIESLLLAADFLKVEDFEFLPKMIKPLRLDDLKVFFRKMAKELGTRAVK